MLWLGMGVVRRRFFGGACLDGTLDSKKLDHGDAMHCAPVSLLASGGAPTF